MDSVTITPEDFDKAVSVPWTTRTCLVAQTAIRHGISPSSGSFINMYNQFVHRSPNIKALQHRFDRAHGSRVPWIREDLGEVRASLPQTFKLS